MSNVKYLNERETRELFQKISGSANRHAVRNRAIFQTAKYCALRAGEIGMLRIGDYDMEKHQLFCTREKGSYNNTIRIIDPDVSGALDAYYQERILNQTDNSALFLSNRNTPISRHQLHKLMKEFCEGIHIPKDKQHFHVLKHTRAVELAELGVDLKNIQWWLGHKNISNTLIYLQFTTRQQEALYKYLEEKQKEKK